MEKWCLEQQEQLHKDILEYMPSADFDLLDKAFYFGCEAHKEQLRLSGEPYFTHCVEVAKIMSDMRMDMPTIIASLLHDVVEDTGIPITEVKEKFGADVALLVDGVTKISEVTADKVEIRQAENFRKMLLSMVNDIRVIMIKFGDRLHNMRTIKFLPPKKQEIIARETLEVYAPLAHRLGIAKVRWELEDLSFKVLDSEAYRDIVEKVQEKKSERDAYVERIKQPLIKELEKAGINAQIQGRAKSFYSIYNKIRKRGVPFEEMYDLFAIRILVERVEDCYHTLGIVHTLFHPVPERFKDYIANPKLNGYQSIHTTVVGPGGRALEIQIRTHQMHRTSEIGIASHWRYKEGKTKEEKIDRELDWLRTILEFQEDSEDPRELLESLKIDLFQDEVFVFTPKGDLLKLPLNATPIDFAFAVHTSIGMRCLGAKINGKIVPLNTSLKSGDSIEIITSSSQHPHPDWIKYVKTAKARGHIKRWSKILLTEQSKKLGEELLTKELKSLKYKETDGALTRVAQELGFHELNSLYSSIGHGDTPVKTVIKKLIPEVPEEKFEVTAQGKIYKKLGGSPHGVRVQGMDNLLINFGKCCRPVPGDEIVGFLTRGKGVTIHRANCNNLLHLMEEPERSIDVEWDVPQGKFFLVGIRVLGEDRRNFLRDLADAISSNDVNILNGTLSVEGSIVCNNFLLEIKSTDHLTEIMRNIIKIKGVISVDRLSGEGEV